MMGKMPISWHKECLKNRLDGIARQAKCLEQMEEELLRDQSQADFLKEQIEEAIRRGKEGFDSDKFLRKVAKHFD